MVERSAYFRRYLTTATSLRPAPVTLNLSIPRLASFRKPRSASISPYSRAAQDRHNVKRPRLIELHNGAILQGTNVPYKKSALADELKTAANAALKLKSVEGRPNAAIDRAIKEELRWLQDPLKLANQVRATLEKGNEEKALALVRAASKSMTCIVAWNHILDHYMAQGKTKVAQKLYNEMKKRAQFPDSYSYNILLSGLADHAHQQSTVLSALSIYHSLHAPNSRVKPTITHSNSALNVCARNNDLDALWGIVSRLPSKGAGSPDNYTFTIILNAIRQNALVSIGDERGEIDSTQVREAAIRQGRTIWADIVYRWRQGDLWIDERLVCAMGRLLAIGERPHDWDDIFSLVEQTMNIPRLFPRLGTTSAPRVDSSSDHDERSLTESTNLEEPFDFRPSQASSLPRRTQSGSSLSYAIPSRNTLSLILMACLKMAQRRAATVYWELLTKAETYNIVPDLDNKNSYLRILRQARAARAVVDFVRVQMTEKPHLVKTYRIAMSTCVRCVGVARRDDVTAVHAANKLFELMEQRLLTFDFTTLRQYVDVLKTADCADLEPIAQGIKLLLGDGLQKKSNLVRFREAFEIAESPEEEAKIRNIVRDVIAILDRCISKGVGDDQLKLYREFKNKLNSILGMIDRDGRISENPSDS